jgi:hypothetical protein
MGFDTYSCARSNSCSLAPRLRPTATTAANTGNTAANTVNTATTQQTPMNTANNGEHSEHSEHPEHGEHDEHRNTVNTANTANTLTTQQTTNMANTTNTASTTATTAANTTQICENHYTADVSVIYKHSFGRTIVRPNNFRPNYLSAERLFGRKVIAGKKISVRPNLYTQIEGAVIAPFDLTFTFSAEK